MARGKISFGGQTFEALVQREDNGRWSAQVLELDTKNDPKRFEEEAESETGAKTLCEAFLSELFQQKLWR
jgi:hypothetical protein